MKGVLYFHNFFGFLVRSSHTLHWRRQLQFWEMGEATSERSSRFRPLKSWKEEVSLLERIQSLKVLCKNSGLSMISEIGELRARKNPITRAGECVQRLLCSPCANSSNRLKSRGDVLRPVHSRELAPETRSRNTLLGKYSNQYTRRTRRGTTRLGHGN